MLKRRLISILPAPILRSLRRVLTSNGRFAAEFEAKREKLTDRIQKMTGGVVQSGPFLGMKLIAERSWGDQATKLLGIYERELFPALMSVISAHPDVVVNVGCAEGYYAVGLGRHLSSSTVIAYDLSELAQQVTHRNAVANETASITSIKGLCTDQDIIDIAGRHDKPFFLIDCEGAEIELLTMRSAAKLGHATILVECHDFVDSTITGRLLELFKTTHCISKIEQSYRDPNSSQYLSSFSETEKWTIISEQRPTSMHWLFMTPIAPG